MIIESFEDYWGPIKAGTGQMPQAYLALPEPRRRAVREEVHERLSRFESNGRLLMSVEIARSTVAKLLRDHGIPPASGRPSSWRTFLRAHWGVIAGADAVRAGSREPTGAGVGLDAKS